MTQRRRFLLPLLLLAVLLGSALPAAASEGGTAMPWDSGITALKENLTGPLATGISICAMAVAGLLWATTEHQQGVRKLLQVVFGAALMAFSAQALSALGVLGATI